MENAKKMRFLQKKMRVPIFEEGVLYKDSKDSLNSAKVDLKKNNMSIL